MRRRRNAEEFNPLRAPGISMGSGLSEKENLSVKVWRHEHKFSALVTGKYGDVEGVMLGSIDLYFTDKDDLLRQLRALEACINEQVAPFK